MITIAKISVLSTIVFPTLAPVPLNLLPTKSASSLSSVRSRPRPQQASDPIDILLTRIPQPSLALSDIILDVFAGPASSTKPSAISTRSSIKSGLATTIVKNKTKQLLSFSTGARLTFYGNTTSHLVSRLKALQAALPVLEKCLGDTNIQTLEVKRELLLVLFNSKER
ncbi:hypothetical protein BKA61DRAFT_597684 [Leptodontidium sp. MPI-SDFR-AT-0119]|nr:hypothetical protein BKA61DRAFT_597684 [Leptodontidium sp. MPI-SDFR-AT-0119]